MTDTDRRTAAVEALATALYPQFATVPPAYTEREVQRDRRDIGRLAEQIFDALDDSGRAAIVAWLLTAERLAVLECQRRHAHHPETDRGPCSVCRDDAQAILRLLATPAAQEPTP